MKRILGILFQALVLLIGACAIVFLVWMPQVEGRNVNATLFEIYFKDPFLAYVYLSSVPFFVGLYHVFGLVGLLGRGEGYSRPALRAVRIVRYCAMSVAAFIVGAEIYLFVFIRGTDDIAGAAMLGFLVFVACLFVCGGSLIFERMAKNALDEEVLKGPAV